MALQKLCQYRIDVPVLGTIQLGKPVRCYIYSFVKGKNDYKKSPGTVYVSLNA
jgi:hypothetical protein